VPTLRTGCTARTAAALGPRRLFAVTMLSVKVKPRARTSQLLPQSDGTWLAQLKSPPVDGKANAELIALVAQHFGCAKSAVSIKAGAGARTKLVTIAER
jgi:hypothetical protein